MNGHNVSPARDQDPANLALSFRALAEMTNLPLARVDPVKRTFRYVSPAFCEMMGLPEEKLLGMLSWDMLAPEQRATITDSSVFFLRQYRAKPWALSLHPDGGRKFLAIFYMSQVTWDDGSLDTLLRLVETPVTEGATPTTVITKNIPPAQAARASMPVGVWTQSLHEGPWVVNDDMYDLFGLPHPETRGSDPHMSTFELSAFIHPDDLPKLAIIIQEGLLTPSIVNITVRMVRFDGVERVIEILGQTYSRDPDSATPTHSIGTVRDITDQLVAEQAAELVLSFSSAKVKSSRELVERALGHLVTHGLADYAAFHLLQADGSITPVYSTGVNAWINDQSARLVARSARTRDVSYLPEPDIRAGATAICAPISVEGNVVALLTLQRSDPFPDSSSVERIILRFEDWLETYFRTFGLPQTD